jgi:hypothetical protein
LQLPTKATRNKNPMKAQQTPPKKTVPLVLASTIKKNNHIRNLFNVV